MLVPCPGEAELEPGGGDVEESRRKDDTSCAIPPPAAGDFVVEWQLAPPSSQISEEFHAASTRSDGWWPRFDGNAFVFTAPERTLPDARSWRDAHTLGRPEAPARRMGSSALAQAQPEGRSA